MSPKSILSILIACTAPAWVHAADPTTSTLLEQCKSAQGEVKKECEEVATKMLQSPRQERRTDKSDQDVTHSSPVMDTTDAKPAKPAKPAPKPADKPEKKPE